MARPTILIGPPVASMTKEAATEQLKAKPDFPKGVEPELVQHAGRWIASFVETADFGPADSDEESPAPKGESSGGGGGSDDSGDDGGSSGGPPPDDGGSDDDGGDPLKKKKPGSGGMEEQMHMLMQQLDAISQALGIPPVGGGMDAGMGPGGPDGDPMGGPPPGPGAGGPPPPPHAGHGGPPPPDPGGPGASQRVIHQKSGPPPPATFASVKEQHPWGHMIGQAQYFSVAEKCGSDSYADVHNELQRIARAGGFRVARFTPLEGRQGERAVQAIIETPRVQ